MTISEDFWKSYKLTNQELEDIYNYLLETETPLDKFEITKFVISRAISRKEEERIASQTASGRIYIPQDQYSSGDRILFPSRANATGTVKAIRNGYNPDYPDLQVIEVAFENEKMLHSPPT